MALLRRGQTNGRPKYTIFFSNHPRCIEIISLNTIGMVFVINEDEHLVEWPVTEISEAHYSELSLNDIIQCAMNQDFVWMRDSDSNEAVLKRLDSRLKRFQS